MFSDSIKDKLKEKLSSNKTIFINYGSEKGKQNTNQMIKQALNTDRISEMKESYTFYPGLRQISKIGVLKAEWLKPVNENSQNFEF